MDNMGYSCDFDNLSSMEGEHTAETGVLEETQVHETKKKKMVSDHYQIPLKHCRTSVIVQNPNVPQAQTVQLDQETQIGFGNGAGPQLKTGSKLEPEKEKIHNMSLNQKRCLRGNWKTIHNTSLNKKGSLRMNL